MQNKIVRLTLVSRFPLCNGYKMTRAKPISKKEKCFQRALLAVDRGMDRRRASFIARMPLSTFQYRLMHKDDIRSPRTALTSGKEGTIVTFINRYSAKGFSLSNEDIAAAVELLVSSLPQSRQQKLPFVNNRPGKKFCTTVASVTMTACSLRDALKKSKYGESRAVLRL